MNLELRNPKPINYSRNFLPKRPVSSDDTLQDPLFHLLVMLSLREEGAAIAVAQGKSD